MIIFFSKLFFFYYYSFKKLVKFTVIKIGYDILLITRLVLYKISSLNFTKSVHQDIIFFFIYL
jgi:hypothetical protein